MNSTKMLPIEENLMSSRIIGNLTKKQILIKGSFYYDETNNYRKVYYNQEKTKLNITKLDDFCLGGIFLENNRKISLEKLKKTINLNQTAPELKFKHVAQGDFENILSSKKIKTVLEYIYEKNISIHYHNVNIFFWFIIDIIESIIASNLFPINLIENHMEIKNALYIALSNDIDVTLKVLSEFGYPDINRKSIAEFYEKIIELVRSNNSTSANAITTTQLIFILEKGMKQEEAIFIHDESKNLLIGDFSIFYRGRIGDFPKAKHYIDEEQTAIKDLSLTPNSYKNSPLNNYKFLKSHESEAIQLSDVVIGFFGRMLNFTKYHTIESLYNLKSSLSEIQNYNLLLSKKIILQSNEKNAAFFNQISPTSEILKLNHLLN